MAFKQARVFVSGRVQGVFFRAEAKNMADSLGLTGWVRNLPDGRVEAVFEGEEDKIKEAIRWCHKGPAFARVDDVRVEWSDSLEGYRSFQIKYF